MPHSKSLEHCLLVDFGSVLLDVVIVIFVLVVVVTGNTT